MTLQMSAAESLNRVASYMRGASQGGEDLEHVVGQIRSELATLQERQAAISKRIASIRTAVTSLAEIFGEKAIPAELRNLLGRKRGPREQAQPGLTELCRTLLRESSRPLTLPDLLHQIVSRRPAVLANHKNPRVSLAVVLKRLVDYTEAERVLSAEGLRAWRWARNPGKAANSGDPTSEE